MQDAYFRFPDAHADTEGTISLLHKNCTKCKAREMQHWRKSREMQHSTDMTSLVLKISAAENVAVHCTGRVNSTISPSILSITVKSFNKDIQVPELIYEI